jgi:hypothetical protein
VKDSVSLVGIYGLSTIDSTTVSKVVVFLERAREREQVLTMRRVELLQRMKMGRAAKKFGMPVGVVCRSVFLRM